MSSRTPTAATATAPPASTIISDTPVAPASASSSSSSLLDFWRYNNSVDALQPWILPGTIAAGVGGLTVGGSIAAVMNRPLLNSAKNVGLKFAIPTYAYLAGVTMWTQRAPPEWNTSRFTVHTLHGITIGSLLGFITGRAPGAVRGGLAGCALALPTWWILEGRFDHQRQKEEQARRETENKRIDEYMKAKKQETKQQIA